MRAEDAIATKKMYRYGRMNVTEEDVIHEFNCIEQIYIRFQAPFGLN